MSLTYHRKDILSHFTCQNTGKCCLSPGYVYVNQENIASMSRELNVSIDFFMNHFVTRINGWDVIASPTFRTHCFLEPNNRCEVYLSRPDACRTYPDWDAIWESEDTIQKEAQSCEGLNRAITKFKRAIKES
tara:strand:- start:3313 stop:3708 length:396 start_codon:yes stop_codon:yes gene_type:complete